MKQEKMSKVFRKVAGIIVAVMCISSYSAVYASNDVSVNNTVATAATSTLMPTATVESTPEPVPFTLKDRDFSSSLFNKGVKRENLVLKGTPIYKTYINDSDEYFLYRKADNYIDIIRWVTKERNKFYTPEKQEQEELFIPDSIGDESFENIVLTEVRSDVVTLADGIKTFEYWMRPGDLLDGKPERDSYYSDIEILNVGKSFEEMPKTFGWWVGLEQVNVSEKNPKFMSKKGVVFSKDGKVLEMFPLSNSKNYVIPNGTVKMRKSIFECSETIRTVVVPRSMKKIENRAFFCCPNLKKIIIKGKNTKLSKNCGISYYVKYGRKKKHQYKNGLTIVAPTGSKAQNYAKKNGIKFEVLK